MGHPCMSRVNPFKKNQKQGKSEAREETKEEDGVTKDASTKSPDLTAIRENFEKCGEALEGHTEMVLGSLNQVPTHSLPPSS